MSNSTSSLLSPTEINESVENISMAIRKEIENLSNIFNLKHDVINEETNKAILNLPLVKKIILEYEKTIQSKSVIKEECNCNCNDNYQNQNNYLTDVINKQMKTILNLTKENEMLLMELNYIKNIKNVKGR